jgi:hypothetical protein
MPSGHDWHWTFGNGCHIEFAGGGDPSVAPDHAFNSHEGSATFSDGAGQLLFYTDGETLYDRNDFIVATGIGGGMSSCHSAIIVPPAGGGALYHVFAVYEWDNPGFIREVSHTKIKVSGSTVTLDTPPTPLPAPAVGPKRASEKLGVIPHVDCEKYWVVALHCEAPKIESVGKGVVYAMLVDSDAGVSLTVPTKYPWPDSWFGLSMKFSPDGSLIAMASRTTIDIMNFDRATGVVTAHSQIQYPLGTDFSWGYAYGVEFSPNGKYLYFTGYFDGRICRHTIAPATTPIPFSNVTVLGQWPTVGSPRPFRIGALQLAPNGKIYGTKVTQKELFEIGDPNSPVATASGVKLDMIAKNAAGGPLLLNKTADLGLPTFTRIADDCQKEPPLDNRCARIAAKVGDQLTKNGENRQNAMETCDGVNPEKPDCAPLEIPAVAPWTSIRWGDSRCDCIEGDDTEIMHITICNPYKNLTLSNMVVHEVVVVDAKGNPVPALPDGSSSIQLVPIGPYCFGDLAPCTCVTREFVLRLRGAPGGQYRILLNGICFDACFHGDEEACFTFDVCKD